MTGKERVQAVLRGEETDAIPYGEYAIDSDTVEKVLGHETYLRAKAKTQIALWEGRRDEVVQSLKEDIVALYEKLDCLDIVNLMSEACGLVPPKDYVPLRPKKIREDTWEDSQGRVYKFSPVTRDITMVHDPMLWEREYEPEDFPLYDILPPDASQFEVIDHVIGRFREEKYIIGYAGREAGFVLLGGMERGLTEYLSNPEGVQAAIDQATALGNQEDAYFIRPGQDAVFWGQDFAYNSGPLMDPKLFTQMVLPSVKQRVENAKAHGVAVFKHCCGNTKDLRDFFLEAGYDCYQSLQKQAGMDLGQLRQLYGNRMCLWGGIDVANLIGGSREQVRQETMEAIEIAKQGGVILGSSHSIATGCNYDNVMTMMETIANHR